ncbi:hypothetical protein ACH5RR_019817 [Cinchona calisaya]|uniref:ACB domain-containing protein n=1 Tax=Cinchona calisaya TaxID=153742 RepID=A0ABD2ZQX5_9GENT
MAEWQQFIHSVFFGVIFSFLLAKLFAVIFAFREDNLRVTLGDPTEGSESKPDVSGSDSRVLELEEEEEEPLISDNNENAAAAVKESGSITAAGGEDGNKSSDDSDSDSDWEGVECTELDEAFSAATAFVAATAADRSAQKVSNDVQLQLYGLYKIATEGPCSTPQPSPLKMTARAKWQAWQKLGAMPPEEAMQKYIEIVTELYPSWITSTDSKKEGKEYIGASSAESKGPMGPVFSTFTYEDEPGNDLKLEAMHAFAREGDMENLLKCIESGVPVNVKDSEGRTPLHWAVDRGHLKVTELLLSKDADINAKDNDGQTALHYAVICERATLADFLVKHKADIEMKDNDGSSPADLCNLNWPWMQQSANATD